MRSSTSRIGLFVSGGAVTPLGAAAGAAAGSIASQLAGNVMSVQDGFNWKGVGLSALSGGIAGGLGTTALAGSAGWQDTALRMAAANTLTQGVGVITGLQRSFDWRGVAASAAGAAAGQAAGQALGRAVGSTDWSPFAKELVTRTGAGLAAGTMASLAQGGRVSVQQVVTDAFGNALGSSLANASTGTVLQAQTNQGLYSLGDSNSGQPGLWLGSGEGLRYGNARASSAQDIAESFDFSSIEGLRGAPPVSNESWVLASGPQNTASDAGNGYGPGMRDALPSAQAVAGAVAGVGASLGRMAYGTVRTLSDTFNQALDIVTGGAFHDTPLMQRSWENNTALGKGIINLAGSPVETANNLIEDVVNRYSLASSITNDDFQRGYEFGGLLNDVGQAALGLGAGVRSLSTGLASYGNYSLGNAGVDAAQTARAAGELPSLGWPGKGGAGPVPGTIGITDSTSVNALRNYYPKGGGVEFVYEPTTNTFVAGKPVRGLFDGSPHEQLAQSIGSSRNSSNVVGGTFQRGPNGEFFTTENSGHYGKNWNNDVRAQFQQWLGERVQRPVVHESWRR